MRARRAPSLRPAHRRVQRLHFPSGCPVEDTTTEAKRVLSDPAFDDRRPKPVQACPFCRLHALEDAMRVPVGAGRVGYKPAELTRWSGEGGEGFQPLFLVSGNIATVEDPLEQERPKCVDTTEYRERPHPLAPRQAAGRRSGPNTVLQSLS